MNCDHFLGTQASLGFPRMELWRYTGKPGQGWLDPMERVRIEVPAADPLTLQLEHFCRVVRGEEAPVIDALDGSASLAVALAVRESAMTKSPRLVSSITDAWYRG